jgi:GNS1/SUR4 family
MHHNQQHAHSTLVNLTEQCSPDRYLATGTLISQAVECKYFMGAGSMLSILFTYLIVVVWLGTTLFKRAYPKGLYWLDGSMRPVIALYDWLQVMFNAVVLAMVALNPGTVAVAWKNLARADGVVLNADHALLVELGSWWYWLKVLDLVDTAFFIVRGKFRHVSFLQVYHHASMVLMVWISLHYVPVNQNLFYAGLNSAVHVPMYAYYMFSTLGISVPWKKLITRIQMLQFVIMFLFTSYLLLCVHTDPMAFRFTLFAGVQSVAFLALFTNFYVKEYLQRRRNNNATANMTTRQLNRHMD